MVHARRRKGELRLVTLKADQRRRALALAEQLHRIASSHLGRTREELTEAWAAVRVGARERKLSDGLKKLIEDGLTFEMALDADPIALRREVFTLAATRRAALEAGEAFDRDGLLEEVAQGRGLDRAAIEAGLFGDLRQAHVLREIDTPPPSALVAGYDLEQARAVLLRAVRVTVLIRGATPAAVRTLFRKLKFQRLLHTVSYAKDGALRIDIDGPYSLFESVTKYGLALAIALPSITSCGDWTLEADVRWGAQRQPLIFRLAGGAAASDTLPARLPREVETLMERFGPESKRRWTAQVADEVIELPGVGLCVPDLAFTHRRTGEIIFLEVMGFWSREAVWKRIELVQAGVETKILFAVSKRLRVSESALDDELPGALYVYKGAMSAKQVEAKLDALAER